MASAGVLSSTLSQKHQIDCITAPCFGPAQPKQHQQQQQMSLQLPHPPEELCTRTRPAARSRGAVTFQLKGPALQPTLHRAGTLRPDLHSSRALLTPSPLTCLVSAELRSSAGKTSSSSSNSHQTRAACQLSLHTLWVRPRQLGLIPCAAAGCGCVWRPGRGHGKRQRQQDNVCSCRQESCCCCWRQMT